MESHRGRGRRNDRKRTAREISTDDETMAGKCIVTVIGTDTGVGTNTGIEAVGETMMNTAGHDNDKTMDGEQGISSTVLHCRPPPSQ